MEPLADPAWDAKAMYHVGVFDSTMTLIARFGAATDDDLRRLLRMVGISYAPCRTQIWHYARQEWHHPGGVVMAPTWDGLLNVECRVHVGSFAC